MFSSDTKKLKDINTTNVSTIIGEGTVIQGDIVYAGGLHIDGRVVGSVSAENGSAATLTLSKLGSIHGSVDVPTVVIDGEVQGDVTATDRVQLISNSRITGNVQYNLIEMEVGAEVNGQLVRQQGERANLDAPTMLESTEGELS
ncbi:MAG: polymer-forming cytoskeletal protein [Cycloclasticus sp.]|jgi:cytoskeletal protein CcmA (bactofilin family)|nr:MAG: cell shape determination protein CcmA [Cycloclasticus sp. Phe_18]MBV1912245.1 polymer-forming cytoskeletal protein [Cycloclasticus sp.]MDF1690353.1 polymer-forming cytoskeletal protein [Cycloclasticus sp.]MEE4291392.1 polymer-forming cytoskeletal protein [Cycloclasticus sp.]